MRRLLPLLALGLAATADGAVADDGAELVVIVHETNRVETLGEDTLRAIFTSSMRSWPNGERIVAFNCPPSSPERTIFDRAVLRIGPDEAGRFWVRTRTRGGSRPPRQVPDDAVAARIIARLPNGIAYVHPQHRAEGTRVVARIRGGQVVTPSTERSR